MARKRSPTLTEGELRLMDVLWERGSATVAEVADALPTELGLAYNTVLTTMRILESKGYLRHSKAADARAFTYRPIVGREEAGRSAVRYLVSRFFRNSAEALVVNLLEDEKLDDAELQRIRKLLAQAEAAGGKSAAREKSK
jgi:predicted transcriptional regulator